MYEIGDKVIYKLGGLFVVDSMKFIGVGGNMTQFICLKPYFLNSKNRSNVIYVPIAKADTLLRSVMSKDEALKYIDDLKNTEPIWINDAKIRRDEFGKMISTHDKDNLRIVAKSLIAQREKLKEEEKFLNLIDYGFLVQVGQEIHEELAVALDKPLEEINKLVLNI